MLRNLISLRFRRWSWLLSIVFMLVGGWSGLTAAAETKPAPAFTLPSSTGGTVQLADYLGKSPILLVFYMGNF